ncbi:DNA/RNA non-specific endonuclease [Moraxella oculi]|uniref:DNA/RNA non-specific endonuclease n=1 Tax=Moraxella oculi TaxID=2940516 RepID=A0ABW8U8F7_9GAMM
MPTDHGGHLIASMFNGLGEGINIVPMDAKFNGVKGRWYEMEMRWRDALDPKSGGGTVQVKIEPIYSGNSKRPDKFIIQERINGVLRIYDDFYNNPTGKKTMTEKLDDIVKILNDMKPIESDLLIFEVYIYSDTSSFSCYWLINNQRNDFDFDSFPMKQSREIISHIKILKSNDDSWNNFRLCLDADGKFIFDTVNIDEENSWHGLYIERH